MLRLRTLGGLAVLDATGTAVATQRRRVALLALLAVAGKHGLTRDKLVGYLWPESSTEHARHALEQLLYALRRQLGDLLFVGSDPLCLNPEIIESDLGKFEASLARGGDEEAVAQYDGPFLDGFYLREAEDFERWADSQRARLAADYRRALERLARAEAAQGQYRREIEWRRKIVSLDPLGTEGALALMRAFAAAQDRSGALQFARVHEALVRAELSSAPDPAITEFVQQLQAGADAPIAEPPAATGDSHILPEPVPQGQPADDLKQRGFRWALASAGAVLSLLGLAALLIGHPRDSSTGTDPQSLIVIPFVNVGGDSAQAYLADGISDELATTLGKICGIRVLGRSAAYQYYGRRDLDARTVGRAMGAAFVVQGSVRQADGLFRTSVQVTRTDTREEVWSNSYELSAGNAFAVQDEITRAIADSMRARFGGNIGCQLSRTTRRIPDAEAYDLYLRGQYLLRRRGPGVRLAAERFDSAIARDRSFARAYAGSSAALALFPYFANTPPSAVYGRVAEAAQHALALDSTLSEPHTALALSAMRVHAWARADSEHRKALAADSTDPSAHHQYGRYLIYTGQLDSALAEFRRAESLDRLSALYSAWVGYALFEQGKGQAARAEFRRALDIDSLNLVAVVQAAVMYALQDDTAAARVLTERFPNTPPWTASKAYVTGRIGDHAAARAIARAARTDAAGAWFRETTVAYAALGIGDTAQALSAFERATKADEIWMLYNSVGDRMFDPIRKAPRFQALLKRIGLADRPFR